METNATTQKNALKIARTSIIILVLITIALVIFGTAFLKELTHDERTECIAVAISLVLVAVMLGITESNKYQKEKNSTAACEASAKADWINKEAERRRAENKNAGN